MIKTLLAKWTALWTVLTTRGALTPPAEVTTPAADNWTPTTSERGLRFQSELQDFVRRGGK